MKSIAFLLTIAALQAASPEAAKVLEFPQPAAVWVDGLPLGNGLLGAMVLGGVASDRVALNHHRLWRHAAERRNVQMASKLPEYRRLFLAGRYEEAGRLMEGDLMRSGGKQYPYVNPFQPVGDLLLDVPHAAGASGYRRRLDLDTGVAEVTYRVGDVHFRREYFVASAQDNVVVVRLSADRPGAISGRVRLTRTERNFVILKSYPWKFPDTQVSTHAEANRVVLSGKFGEGFPFAAVAAVTVTGGKVAADGEAIRFDGADEAVIVTAMATGDESADPAAWCRSHLANLRLPFAALRERRVAAHRRLFRRVNLHLEDAAPQPAPSQFVEAADRDRQASTRMVERLFDYGRYLLISSSHPGGLPANLQGIWNELITPPWDSDYHMDLNLEFNYWPAEICDLSELHQPFFDWAEARVPDGRRMAKDLFGCRGIWFNVVGDSTGLGNVDNLSYSWPGAAGWLSRHFWEHWEYTGDREFLARRAYPFLKEVGAFYLDYLVKDAAGRYMVIPSMSPENYIKGRQGWTQFQTVSSTMDVEIARDVFRHLVAAAGILKTDAGEVARWREVLANLPPRPLDATGRLREYSTADEPKDPAHRHLSPLYGLHPGDGILADGPAQVEAARKLLDYRLSLGDSSVGGWSYPWRVALFARLGEGDKALQQIDELAGCCVNENLLGLVTDWRQRPGHLTWFGGAKVFQIETNLAFSAAVAGMLLESQGGTIQVLPALPGRWPAGRVSGLVARGGFVVDVDWQGGVAGRIGIHSRLGNVCRLKVAGGPRKVVVANGGRKVPFRTLPGGVMEFATRAAGDYEVLAAR
jgi:alpha-L-fucosidase 2